MNLLDIATKAGRAYKKAGTTHGGEYQGPCPTCGGENRFHIWPHQGDHGTYWCRSCDQAGDAIQYLMQIDGMTFKAAAATVGKDISGQDEYQAPRFVRPRGAGDGSGAFTPRTTTTAADIWVEHATKFCDACHAHLLVSPEHLSWLNARGLSIEAVKQYRLGWNAGHNGKDAYRVREGWGLPPSLKDDGKPKKLWLPVGLTIPMFSADGVLQRLRIRRPDGEPRYYLVPGSNTAPLIVGAGARAYVIVESELDALLIHHHAGELVGAISQGNSTAKPDEVAATLLAPALTILVALDSDAAGMQASVWWRKNFPQAERWPVPVGKDPGEAFQAGVSIKEWVKAGLPPVFHVAELPDVILSEKPAMKEAGTITPAREMTADERAEACSAMYDDVNALMPADGLDWLRRNRTDIVKSIRGKEALLDDEPQNFAINLDLVRRMYLRAWQVVRDSTPPELPPLPEGPPAYQPTFL